MTHAPARRRSGPGRRGGAAALLTLGWLLLLVGTAAAHPAVTGSSPPEGARLLDAPSEVSISFGEDVEAPLGSLRVYDTTSERVDLDDARLTGLDGRTVTATLRPDLPDGAYVIIWRAIGLDDGHLVLGQQSFVVGHGVGATAGAGSDVAPAGAAGLAGHGPAAALASVSSTIGGLATVVVLGAALLALRLLPSRDPRWRPARGRLTLLVHAAAAVGALASLTSIPALAAARAAAFGTPLDLPTLAAVVTSPAGTGALARGLLLTTLLAPLLLGVRWYVVAATSLAAATLALDGHVAGVGLLAGVLHVAAVAVWAGGLVGLVVALPAAPDDDARGLADLLGRFSRTALGAVLGAGVAGGLLAVATVGTDVAAASPTPWGETMTTKLVVLTAALLVAAHTRTVVLPGLRGGVRAVPAGGSVDVRVGPDPATTGATAAHGDGRGRLPTTAVSAAPDGVLGQLRRNLVLEALLVAAVVLTSGVLADRATSLPVGVDPGSEAPGEPADEDEVECALPSGMPLAHDGDCFPTLPDIRT